MSTNYCNYQYDEMPSLNPNSEPFEPPIDQIFMDDLSHGPRLLDAPNDATDLSTNTGAREAKNATSSAEQTHEASAGSSMPVSDPSSRMDPSASSVPLDDITYDNAKVAGSSLGEEDKSLADHKPRKDRLKEKRSKAKDKFPEKEKLIKKDKVVDKKQKQLVRNRISAQRSRDRKRSEIVELREENIKLRIENEQLKARLAAAEGQVLQCGDSGPRHHSSGTKTPLLLAAAFVGCICIVCVVQTFAPATNSSGVYVSAPIQTPALSRRVLAAPVQLEPKTGSAVALEELKYSQTV